MNVRPLLVANAQPSELIQPSECPFHYPPPSTQPGAVVGVALCKKRDDAPVTKTLPDRFGIVTTVRRTGSQDDGAAVPALRCKNGIASRRSCRWCFRRNSQRS
jgi:hypothetical protein